MLLNQKKHQALKIKPIDFLSEARFQLLNLYGEPTLFFNDFQTAKKSLLQPENKEKMLLQCAIPALSHMSGGFPICEYYHLIEDDGTLTCYFVDN